jgi:hypothetical protein
LNFCIFIASFTNKVPGAQQTEAARKKITNNHFKSILLVIL